MPRRSMLTVASLLVIASIAPAGADPVPIIEDNAKIAGTILPPGADHAHALAEIAPYDNLVYGYPTLTEDTLFQYFKNAGFGPQGTVVREYAPRPGVRILRDERWGVPHVYGETDEDVWFGAGYASAEDRLPIMDLLRALGRAEAFDLLGTTPAWFADGEMLRLYGYTEDEFQEMIARLPKLFGPEGEEVVESFRQYVDGINHYVAQVHRGEVPLPTGYAEIGRLPAPWRETDIVAAVTVVRALFGAGGGGELTNAAFLASLEAEYGPANARAIYDDFRNRFNLDGPVHTQGSFPYNHRPANPDPAATIGGGSASNASGYSSGTFGLQQTLEDLAPGQGAAVRADELLDLSQRASIDWDALNLSSPLGAIDLRPKGMSNALVVGADRSADGQPILLGGPQTGYFSPEILLELDLHGPTIHARGAAFPGLSMYILLGRSADAAWTATAGGSDMIDLVVEVLCEEDGSAPTEHSYSYRYEGSCEPMDRRLHRALPHVPGAPASELPDLWAERTVHGPVIARGEVDGTPVAIAMQRSTYLREVDSAVPFLRLNRNEVTTGEAFVDTMSGVNLATNWLFAGNDDIAYVHGGLYPLRHPDVDPDLPRWGTGEWEWQGLLDLSDHPNAVDPDTGYLTSWNNRPAHDWGATDNKWGWSSLYRADMLDDRIEADEAITPVELVQMMEEAGLTDFRGSHVAPLALEIMESVPAPTAREQQMADILRAWIDDAALRRDADQDGVYEHDAAIAIMDAWWSRMINAVYAGVIDPGSVPLGFDNAPGLAGSAYQDGFYGQVWTDLSQVLGDPVASPTSQVYCGSTSVGVDGTFGDCADRLWASLADAGEALAGDQGDDPASWTMDPELERIRFLPGAMLSMHWVNRPTFQQLTQFRG